MSISMSNQYNILTDKKYKFENEHILNEIQINQGDKIVRKSKMYKNRSHNAEPIKFDNNT